MDKDIDELLPFYALDALTEEERELVESIWRSTLKRQQVEEMGTRSPLLAV
jgi:hypothetical protein